MDKESTAAVITGVIGIAGVLAGSLITVVQAAVGAWVKRRKEAAYLAILVVAHLDRLAASCLYVALDDGSEYGRPAGEQGEEYRATTSAPEFKPLEINVDWKVLPRDLMYAILELPGKRERIQNRLAGIEEYASDYPDHTEWFWSRRRAYAELGLEVSAIVKRLQDHASMPSEKQKKVDWGRDSQLQEVIEKIDQARASYEQRIAEHWANCESKIAIGANVETETSNATPRSDA